MFVRLMSDLTVSELYFVLRCLIGKKANFEMVK